MRRRRAWVVGFVAAACAATGACSAVIDLQPPPTGEGGTPLFDGSFTLPDATFEGGALTDSPDSALADGTLDAGDADASTEAAAPCSPIDADVPDSPAPTTWSSIADFAEDAGVTSWEYFDLTPLGAHAQSFAGGVYDGRYVYYVPNSYGLVMRYDTTQPFNAGSAWSTFDTTTLSSSATSFAGAVFDGRYVYFVPHTGGSYGGLVVRFDTTGTFGPGPAWSTFDTTTLPVDGGEAARGFYGGTFDGRYVYLVPSFDGTNRLGRVARFDTQAGAIGSDASTDAQSDAPADAVADAPADAVSDAATAPPTFGGAQDWQTLDLASLDQSATGFIGGAFDGRYLYLVPNTNAAGSSGIVARYDATKPIESGWLFVDLTNLVDPAADGFFGAAFDGRYLYLVPHSKSKVARYDTTASFASKTAWTTFDLAQLAQLDGGTDHNFSGAAFDGRFVYFMPQPDGQIVRYDTLSSFSSTCAWSVYDLAAHVLPGATYFYGAVYDGRYLYLAPHRTLALRFDTKTPAWKPAWPLTGGSFF